MLIPLLCRADMCRVSDLRFESVDGQQGRAAPVKIFYCQL